MNRQPASVESILTRRKAQRHPPEKAQRPEGLKASAREGIKAVSRARRTTYYPTPEIDARFRAARARFLLERGEDLPLTAALNIAMEGLLDDFEAHGEDSILIRRLNAQR